MTATSGQLALLYGQGSANGVIGGVTSTYNVTAPVNLPDGPNFSTQLGAGGAVKNYTVITSLGIAGDTSSTSLQGMNNSQGSLYALGANIDASDTINWNGGLGFMPVNVGGGLDGLGHVVSNLTINRPAQDYVGMISATYQSAKVSNIGLSGGSITGNNIVGGLIGMSAFGGVVSNSFSNANVTGALFVGGLVGYAPGALTITKSYNSGAVTGYSNVGGLIGQSMGGLQLSQSFNLGQITATAPNSFFYGNAGGLVGSASGANIEDVFNLGRVQSTNSAAVIGGVVGDATDNSVIQRSYNNGVISGRESIGGISGYNRSGSNILNSYNLGSVYAEWSSGGITGYNYGGIITNTFNSAAITSGVGTAGAIVGNNYFGIVTDSYWNSNVASRGTYFGNPNWGGHNLEGVAQNVRALSSDAMKQPQNYTATSNSATPLWDFNDIWYASGSSTLILRSSPFVATAKFGATQTYGSVNTASAVNYANMWGNDDSSIVSGLTLNTTASGFSGAGDYAITGTGASATNAASGVNYIFIFKPGTLTINKAHLTVTANNANKTYGDANPLLGTTVSGFVNGENLATSGVSGAGVASTAATTTTG
ncbi:MAG: MBG domain-containing protein, partial [Crocinitomicaceae bacterium]|nr:MBG domain-containing protein [Crocinitomicaceae bacterium]